MKTILRDEVGVVEDVVELDKPRLMYLYTIYDSGAEDSAPPFCAVNDRIAKRQVIRMLVNNDMPEDYKLYKIGIFDPSIPAIMDVMLERIEFMVDLSQYKELIRKREVIK